MIGPVRTISLSDSDMLLLRSSLGAFAEMLENQKSDYARSVRDLKAEIDGQCHEIMFKELLDEHRKKRSLESE